MIDSGALGFSPITAGVLTLSVLSSVYAMETAFLCQIQVQRMTDAAYWTHAGRFDYQPVTEEQSVEVQNP